MNELIEYLRCKMIDLANERGSLTHPEVVAASEQLDDYIVKAQRVLRHDYTENVNNRSHVGSTCSSTTDIHGLDWLTDFVELHDSNFKQTVSQPF